MLTTEKWYFDCGTPRLAAIACALCGPMWGASCAGISLALKLEMQHGFRHVNTTSLVEPLPRHVNTTSLVEPLPRIQLVDFNVDATCARARGRPLQAK